MPIDVYGFEISNFNIVTNSITAEVSVTATSSATGTTCIGTGVFDVYNGGNYEINVFTPYLTIGTTNLDVELFQGHTAATGTFLQALTGHMTASVSLGVGMTFQTIQNLAAGANELTVTAFVDAGTGKFGAGTGATGHAPQARIMVSPA